MLGRGRRDQRNPNVLRPVLGHRDDLLPLGQPEDQRSNQDRRYDTGSDFQSCWWLRPHRQSWTPAATAVTAAR